MLMCCAAIGNVFPVIAGDDERLAQMKDVESYDACYVSLTRPANSSDVYV